MAAKNCRLAHNINSKPVFVVFASSYLERAVDECFIQVNHHTLFAIVRYYHLREEVFGWWLWVEDKADNIRYIKRKCE